MHKAQLATAAGLAAFACILAVAPVATLSWDDHILGVLVTGILVLVGVAMVGVGVLGLGLIAASLAGRLRPAARSSPPAGLPSLRARRAYS